MFNIIRHPIMSYKRLWKRSPILGVLVGAGLLLVPGAGAYYVMQGVGSATGTSAGMAGERQQAVNLSVEVPGGLEPGSNNVSVYVYASNPSAERVRLDGIQLGNLAVDKQHADAGCQASWFPVGNDTMDATQFLGPNEHGKAVAVYPFEFTNDPNTDQSACEGATLTLDASTGQ